MMIQIFTLSNTFDLFEKNSTQKFSVVDTNRLYYDVTTSKTKGIDE